MRQQLELGIGLAITDSRRRIARELEMASTVKRVSRGKGCCNVTEETRTLRWFGAKSRANHCGLPEKLEGDKPWRMRVDITVYKKDVFREF